MTSANSPVLPLVRCAAIGPESCRRTALILAEAQDSNGGKFDASMACIAAWTGLSKVQARKHVHALVRMDVLRVLANANGGDPLAWPVYQFNVLRLRALGQHPGGTPDMFSASAPPRRSFDALNGTDGCKEIVAMAIEILGRPGKREVRFVREAPQGDIAYGRTHLQALLLPTFAKGAWTGWLNPQEGAPDWADPVYTPSETVERLRQWAQSVALGRVESIETA